MAKLPEPLCRRGAPKLQRPSLGPARGLRRRTAIRRLTGAMSGGTRWTSAWKPSWPTFSRSRRPSSGIVLTVLIVVASARSLRHPPCEGAPALHQEMKSTSFRPAASRRVGSSRDSRSGRRPRPQRAGAGYFYSRTSRDAARRPTAHPRRGPPHGRQLRQAAPSVLGRESAEPNGIASARDGPRRASLTCQTSTGNGAHSPPQRCPPTTSCG